MNTKTASQAPKAAPKSKAREGYEALRERMHKGEPVTVKLHDAVNFFRMFLADFDSAEEFNVAVTASGATFTSKPVAEQS